LQEPKNTGEREEDKEEEKSEGENTSTQEPTIIELAKQFEMRMAENETERQGHLEYVEQTETHHREGPTRAEQIAGNEEQEAQDGGPMEMIRKTQSQTLNAERPGVNSCMRKKQQNKKLSEEKLKGAFDRHDPDPRASGGVCCKFR
jgi:hypothetical protein